jgi:hypothetical protein
MSSAAPLREESAALLVRRGVVLAAIPAIYTIALALLAEALPGSFNNLIPTLNEFLAPRLLSFAAVVALTFCCLAFAAPVGSRWYRACRWLHDRNAEFAFSCGCIILGVVLSAGVASWMLGDDYPGGAEVVVLIGALLGLVWGTSRHVFSEASRVHVWLTTPRWFGRAFSAIGVVIMLYTLVSSLHAR